MAKKWIRADSFQRKGTTWGIRMHKTGDKMPQPARIIVSYRYWDDTGGLRGWESKKVYDRNFEDWNYAHAVYDEILRRGNAKR